MNMPVMHIDLWEGRDKETKRKLIQSVSKAVSESLNIPIERFLRMIGDSRESKRPNLSDPSYYLKKPAFSKFSESLQRRQLDACP
jgi:hypothetical protein